MTLLEKLRRKKEDVSPWKVIEDESEDELTDEVKPVSWFKNIEKGRIEVKTRGMKDEKKVISIKPLKLKSFKSSKINLSLHVPSFLGIKRFMAVCMLFLNGLIGVTTLMIQPALVWVWVLNSIICLDYLRKTSGRGEKWVE